MRAGIGLDVNLAGQNCRNLISRSASLAEKVYHRLDVTPRTCVGAHCGGNLILERTLNGRTRVTNKRRFNRGRALPIGRKQRRQKLDSSEGTRRPTDRSSEPLFNRRLNLRLLTLTTNLIEAIKRMPPAQTMGEEAASATAAAAPPSRLYAAWMLRPGQPGAPYFDKVNVTDFLRQWNAECDDCGLDAKRKCERLWSYCSEEVKQTLEFFEGYRQQDWTTLEQELKTFFYRYDSSRSRHIHDLTALNQIVLDARKMDLSTYVLKFAAVSATLAEGGSLSKVERVSRLLDGLEEDLRRRMIKNCAKKDWKVSTRSRGTVEPDFDELKKLILAEANAEELTLAYEEDSSSRKGVTALSPISITTPTSTPSPISMPMPTPLVPPPPAVPSADAPKDPISELTAKFEAMTLQTTRAIEKMVATISAQQSPPGPESGGMRQYPRIALCYFCDEEGHTRRDCQHYRAAEQQGLVRLGADGKVLDAISGQPIPLGIRRGGMKAFLGRTTMSPATGANAIPVAPRPNVSAVNTITLEETAQLGEDNTVCLAIQGKDGNWYQAYVDAAVEVKRKANDGEDSYAKRPRMQQPANRPTPMNVDPPAQQPQSHPLPRPSAQPVEKFKLASDMQKGFDPATLGNRVLDLPMTMTVRETLAASPAVTEYIVDMSKKKRQPIVGHVGVGAEEHEEDATVASTSTVQVEDRSLYSAPSGRAKVLLNGELDIRGTLDHGSEINLMSTETFEKLDVPIDDNINWRLGTIKQQVVHPVVGVCHDVPVTVGGVTTRNQIFVVDDPTHDLLLGRPWERVARACIENRDDGSCWVTIKAPDGLREVTFKAAEANSGRERAHVRGPVKA